MNPYGCDRCGDTRLEAGICQVCGHVHPVEAAPDLPSMTHPTQGGYDINDPKAYRLERFENEGVW